MPYRLKNALATFVRATHITLKPHIGKIVEVYVDDIVVKTRRSESFLQDLDGVFQSLREHKMMLNPEKIWAIENMRPRPTSNKFSALQAP